MPLRRISTLVFVWTALASAVPACLSKRADGTHPTREPEPTVNLVMIPSPVDATDFRILFRTGSVDDPAGREGLTALTAKLMVEGGAGPYSYPELLQILYPLAAEIRVQVDREMTVFMARVHRDHLNAFVPLLKQLIIAPRFEAQAFERLRADALNYIRKDLRMADDEQLSIQALDVWMHAGHPYGHLVTGTVAGLEAIQLDEVKAHWKNVFTRDRLTVGLAGAVGDDLAKRIRESLASLPPRGAPAVTFPEVAPIQGIRVQIIQKDTESTAITLGYPLDVGRAHPDYHALWLAQSALGEHRQTNGRLFQAIRERRGLNYGDYAYIEPYLNHGWTTKPTPNIAREQHSFSIWIRPVQHQHRLFTLRLLFHTLSKLIREGLTQAELDRTRSFLEGYTRIFEDSLDRRLGYALDDRFYRSGGAFLERARAAFPTLTLPQVNQAIRSHLRISNLKVVIVTRDAESLRQALGDRVKATIAYDTPKPPEVHTADREVVGFDPGFEADKIEIVPAESLFEK